MRSSFSGFYRFWLVIFFASLLSGCGYNKLQALDEQVSAAWAEVVNQYQRRADLVPNLVATVKAYAKHEKEVLTEVTAARSKVGSIKIDAQSVNNPKALADYQQAQGALTGALSRLIAVAESYPDLKASQNFENLMTQLEGTENRVSIARKRYIDAVREYNTLVRRFPDSITAKLFGMKTKANFGVENEAAVSVAPQVNFN